MAQQHEGGDQDLMNAETECLKEEEHSNARLLTSETGESIIQELIEEKSAKLQRELAMKCKPETSSTKKPVTKNNGEDYEEEKDKNELEPNSGKGCDSSNYRINAEMEESLEKRNGKSPMLIRPVILCVFKFLNIKDLKNCRLVCRDWGSTAKLPLERRALIRFHKYDPKRLPVNFLSCFPDSTSNFSAFEISGVLGNESDSNSWNIKELSKFFDEQKKYIKELTLCFEFLGERNLRKMDISSWISKSPLVQKDAKFLTKLVIEGGGNILDIGPLHLIAHIKDLSLSHCRINLEAGIKISPIKLKLDAVTFYQDETKLARVRINDILDLCKTKEVSLHSWDSTKYALDLSGSATLEKLNLDGKGVKIVSGETSQWEIDHLAITATPYSLSSRMNIKELYLSHVGTFDLATLPNSIQKLLLPGRCELRCSQPIVLQKLQFLEIVETRSNFSSPSHFKSCPRLTHLKLNVFLKMLKMKSLRMPKTIKTLTLADCNCRIKWVNERIWNLKTVFLDGFTTGANETKLLVEDLVVYCWDMEVDQFLVDFLEHRQRFGFGKRLFIGELNWMDKQFEESALKEHVDGKSSCYVFQDGQKGRAVSEKAFHELVPKRPVVYT